MIAALAGIEAEMREQVKYFKERDLLIEAQKELNSVQCTI